MKGEFEAVGADLGHPSRREAKTDGSDEILYESLCHTARRTLLGNTRYAHKQRILSKQVRVFVSPLGDVYTLCVY